MNPDFISTRDFHRRGLAKRRRHFPLSFVLAASLALVVLAIILRPIHRAVNDPPPPPAEIAGTIILDRSSPAAVEIARKNDVESTPAHTAPTSAVMAPVFAPTPLPRALIVSDPVIANVREGTVKVSAGLPARLIEQRGANARVQINAVQVVMATAALTSATPISTPAPSPIERITTAVAGTIGAITHAPARSVAIDAHEIGSGHGIARDWETNWGSYNRDHFRTKGLAIQVRNMSRRGLGDCTVGVYWVGRRLTDRSRFIAHAEFFKADAEGGTSVDVVAWCPLVQSRVENYAALGVTHVSGGKLDGWFVLVLRDGKQLVGRGGNATYDTLISDPRLIEPLLATWKGSTKRATANRPEWRKEFPGKSAIPKQVTVIQGS